MKAMAKTKLTITVRRENVRWAKQYVKKNRTSIGRMVDDMIASLKNADDQGACILGRANSKTK